MILLDLWRSGRSVIEIATVLRLPVAEVLRVVVKERDWVVGPEEPSP